jgi:tetratricopeptide (TPR) repeat protein
MFRRALRIILPSAAALFLFLTEAHAQIPEEFTNLQVLSEDVSRGELMGVMRSFSMATGLRCSSCHVGEEGQPFSEYDFASDDKAAKRKAREMMGMVADINDKYLAMLPNRRSPGVEVSCVTCHGGVRRPEAISAIVIRIVEEDGVAAAAERYRDLRSRYFGRAAYDFGERPLVSVAEGLMQGGDLDAAVRILELNLEFLPESAQSTFGLAQIYDQRGETEDAIRYYERTMELAPNNRRAQQRLEALRGGGPSTP